MWSVGLFTLIAASVSLSFGQQVPDQKWGYVTVRPDAHMFWWLYGSTGSDRDTRPLVMWLQVNTSFTKTPCSEALIFIPNVHWFSTCKCVQYES